MIVLTAIIAVDAIRKWKNILTTPSNPTGPVVATETA
jgi:hypothetical protein